MSLCERVEELHLAGHCGRRSILIRAGMAIATRLAAQLSTRLTACNLQHQQKKLYPLPLCGAYLFIGYCGSFLNKLPLPKTIKRDTRRSVTKDDIYIYI